MPAFGKMSDEKNNEMPVVIAEMAPSAGKVRSTKKYVIIAVSGILAAAVILAAILVGMYMFTEAQKEIIQYTLKMSENTKQDVTSNPNENIVQYHISNPSQETWIVNDFGKDIQVSKIKTNGKTTCFVSALNRTNLVDPAKINGPESSDVNAAVTLTYVSSDTPVSDSSFLGKTAREMCQGVSVYWLYPRCVDNNDGKHMNMTELENPKSKRQTTTDYSPYYILSYVNYYYSGKTYPIPCFTGCCRKVCACAIEYYAYYSGGTMYCLWITYTCPPILYAKLSDACTNGPTGLTCPTRYPAVPPTC